MRGTFGRVFLAKKRATGDVFAIKVLKKADMIRKNAVESILLEHDILISVRNPFVVRFFYSFTCKENLYLVMEFLNGGYLFSLRRTLGCLEEDMTRVYIAQLVLALAYLHPFNIIHRDLKPYNLLIGPDSHIKATFIPSTETLDTSYFMSRYIWNPKDEHVDGGSDFDDMSDTCSTLGDISFGNMLEEEGDECVNLAEFGALTLNVNYSFSNFSFKVNALLSSLEINNHGGLVREHMPDGWADEFSQQHGGDPNAWTLSIEQQHGTGGWAFKFQHEKTQMMSMDRMAGANIPSLAAMENVFFNLIYNHRRDFKKGITKNDPRRRIYCPPLLLYHLHLQEVDPFERFTDQDIRTTIHNATGPRSALFMPEVPLQVLVRRQIARLLDHCLQCARLVYNALVKVFNLHKQ
ncbi:unnamed protein product [Lactuca saligna]|uniref:non-specific serine/threonine protein kinase n=1 Tax=Lactuca saligna TaxID=75948 RepID=A0AA35VIA4_LACSI|nr:unnamed protein product [Lactuca saligna]